MRTRRNTRGYTGSIRQKTCRACEQKGNRFPYACFSSRAADTLIPGPGTQWTGEGVTDDRGRWWGWGPDLIQPARTVLGVVSASRAGKKKFGTFGERPGEEVGRGEEDLPDRFWRWKN